MLSKSFNLVTKDRIPPFTKTIEVDSDKSISIRSFLIGSICENISSTKNVLESEDVLSTIKCLKKLGVTIIKKRPRNYLIYGKGLGSLYARKNTELNFGNSGTLARLLLGILSTTKNIDVKIKGDNSLNKRNMKKLIELLSKFGATFVPKNKFKFPLRMISTDLPIGINYKSGISAQLKSAVLLAGLNSFGTTNILELKKSRDHTERMLMVNKSALKLQHKKNIIKIFGKKSLNPIDVEVPGDPSSAAFFTALTLLNKKSSLKIKNVGLNPTRTGFYKLLKKHGAKIKFKNLRKKNNEVRGDIYVKSSKIKPISASSNYYVNSTDEYPILFVLAALIPGTSLFRGIQDLSNKESNRIKEMQKILLQIGVRTKFQNNILKIHGIDKIKKKYNKILVPNLGDHRICMSSFILAKLTGVKSFIRNFETVFTSSPSFLEIIKTLGANFEKQK